MYPYYKAELLNIDGQTIDEIDDIISLQAARSFNVSGAATLVVPDHYPRHYFGMHKRMKLWRYDYRGVPLNFGDTVWFLKKKDHALNDKSIKLEFVDAFAMAGTRVVAYTSLTPYADKTLEELALVTYNDTLRTDNMMRAYMRENFGSLALDTDRVNVLVSIEGDKAIGPYGEKQAAWQEMDAVLSDLAKQASANGLNLYYDLLPASGGTFLFRVWTKVRGLDRGSGTIIDLTLNDTDGTLADIHEIEDWTDVKTVCYALGYDSGPSQVIEMVESPGLVRQDPFSRIEMTVNATDSDVPSVLRAAAQAALNGHRAKRIVTARVVENNALRYGDILYGDVFSVEVAGNKYDVAINAINVRWDEAGEDLDIQLSGEQALSPLLTGGPEDPGIDVPGQVNTAPAVDAGDDQIVVISSGASLVGNAVDDGLPIPPGALTYLWTVTSGPGSVTFGDNADPTTTANFDTPGDYVLRLTASDGALNGFDEVTITVELEPTVPPDFGLLDGVELVAGISADGFLYVTTDFQTVSGSGGPTWAESDLETGFLYSFVVDPFSPGYIEGVGAVNGWVVSDTDIYRVTDMFGTPAITSVHTFATATDNTSLHWRTIQASFGRFFVADEENPWLMVVSYYGDTTGHEGTWVMYSMDAGATWSSEVQLSANYSTGDTRFMPIGLYTSPKTPGLAYTVARGAQLTDGLPQWAIWDTDTGVITPGEIARMATIQVQSECSNEDPTQTLESYLWLCPPPDTKRVAFSGIWSSTFERVGGSTAGSNDSTVDVLDHASATTLTDNLIHSVPGQDDNDSTAGTFSGECTFPGFASGDFPTNSANFMTKSNGDTLRFRCRSSSNGATGTQYTSTTIVTVMVDEIELDDGTILTFGSEPSGVYKSEDWGETWAVDAFTDVGEAMGGSIHLPWPDNSDEGLGYNGYFEQTTVRSFRLMESDGGVVSDISPTDSGVTYGVNRYGFAIRTFDLDRQYLLLSGIGNDTDLSAPNDSHAVFISDDFGATWTMILGPVTDADGPDGRPVYEAAFGGDTQDVVFIWGPDGSIYYSDDFGATVDDRSGNLGALGAKGLIGIAGGPVGP